jgi:hypothetical protein
MPSTTRVTWRDCGDAEEAADLFHAFKNTDGGHKDKGVVQGQIDDAKRLDKFCEKADV